MRIKIPSRKLGLNLVTGFHCSYTRSTPMHALLVLVLVLVLVLLLLHQCSGALDYRIETHGIVLPQAEGGLSRQQSSFVRLDYDVIPSGTSQFLTRRYIASGSKDEGERMTTVKHQHSKHQYSS